MKLHFIKFEGTGNDFIVLDNMDSKLVDINIKERVNFLCDRKRGIGADGLLVCSPSEDKGSAYEMIYYNKDGSSNAMCGNGARCIAWYAHKYHGVAHDHLFFNNGNIYQACVYRNQVQIYWHSKPYIISEKTLTNQTMDVYCGAKHRVIKLDKLLWDNDQNLMDYLDPKPKAGKISTRNITLIQFIDTSKIKAITYERGVESFTLSCGTGAIAGAYAAYYWQLCTSNSIEVDMPGGKLKVGNIFHSNDTLYLHGHVSKVFSGTIMI